MNIFEGQHKTRIKLFLGFVVKLKQGTMAQCPPHTSAVDAPLQVVQYWLIIKPNLCLAES